MSFQNNVVPVHCGSIFTWERTHGVTSVSTIIGKIDARIWSDSSDEGFIVKSHRTGVNVLFVLEEVLRETDGDVRCWVYTPAFANDAPEGTQIVIYNT